MPLKPGKSNIGLNIRELLTKASKRSLHQAQAIALKKAGVRIMKPKNRKLPLQ